MTWDREQEEKPLGVVDGALADRIRESEDRIWSESSKQDDVMTASELEKVIGDLRKGRPLGGT